MMLKAVQISSLTLKSKKRKKKVSGWIQQKGKTKKQL